MGPRHATGLLCALAVLGAAPGTQAHGDPAAAALSTGALASRAGQGTTAPQPRAEDRAPVSSEARGRGSSVWLYAIAGAIALVGVVLVAVALRARRRPPGP